MQYKNIVNLQILLSSNICFSYKLFSNFSPSYSGNKDCFERHNFCILLFLVVITYDIGNNIDLISVILIKNFQ